MKSIVKQLNQVIATVLTITALTVGQSSAWAQSWTVTPYANDEWDPKTKTLTVNWNCVNDIKYRGKWIEYLDIANSNITTIPDDAFNGCKYLKEVSFAEGVVNIGNTAFLDCENLKTVVYTAGTAPSLGRDVFYNTHPDMKIYVSKGLYGDDPVPNPYVECWISGQCAVTLEGSTLVIRGVGEMGYLNSYSTIAWENDKSIMTSAIIEQGVRSIGNYTFSGCTNLTSVSIPDYLTTIGQDAFAGCANLTTLTLPASVTCIDNAAFSGCTGLTTLYVQSSEAPTLGNGVFDGCSALTTVVVPASADYSSWNGLGYQLKPGYFITCEEGFTATNAHNSHLLQPGETATLSPIGGGTAQYVVTKNADGSDVTAAVLSGSTLTMPAYDITVSATTITGNCGKTANDQVTWSYNTSTKVLTISGTGEMADYEANNQPWAGYKNLITSFVVEDGVASIGSKILYQFPCVTSVNIASSVTKIGAEAFYECENLETIIGASGVTDAINSDIFYKTPWLYLQPDGLVYVGHVAYQFKNGPSSTGITSITLADGTTQIANYAFQNSNIRVIVIPASVTSIGKMIFYNWTPKLEKVWFLVTTPPVLAEGAFDGCTSSISDIFVPAASLSSYSTSLPGFSEKLRGGYTVTCGTGVTATTANNIPLVLQSETVTLHVDVPDGFTFSGYSVKDAEGHDVSVSENSGVYTFTMPASDVTVRATYIINWTTLQTLLTNSSTDADNPTVITLDNDIVAESTDKYLEIPAGHHVIIDLNGHTIDRNLTEPDNNGQVFYVRGGSNYTTPSSLTIRDSQGGGTITGGYPTSWNGGGAFFVTYSSTLTIEGGTITGNKSAQYGGGAITATNRSTVRMTGGSITGNVGNTSNNDYFYAAGAVCLLEQSHFYLSGGSITGNFCGGHTGDTYGKDDCGGIGFDNDHPTWINRVHLSGTYTLSGNLLGSYENGTLTTSIPSDYLHTQNNVIVIEDAISPTAPAVITVSNNSKTQVLTSGWSNHMTADPATCFTLSSFYNTSGKGLGIVNGEVSIGTLHTITLGDNITASATSAAQGKPITLGYTGTVPTGYAPVFSATAGSINGNILVMPDEDVTVTATTIQISGICGHTNVNNGKNVIWRYNLETKTLTISGTGAMNNYSGNSQPWKDYMSDITTAVIEEGVTSISNRFLYGCTALTSVTIGSSVTTIGASAFNGCTALTSVTIGSSVTTIGASAFYGCTSLATISGAAGVTTIESSAFDDTAWYNGLPDGLTTVGHVAYRFKGDGTSVTLPDGTTQIYNGAFGNTAITSIIIPASVTSIGDRALASSALRKVYCLASEPPALSAYSFDESLPAIVVPTATYELYKKRWYSYSDYLQPGYTVSCGEGITATSFAPIVAEDETVTLGYTGEVPAGCEVRYSLDGGTTLLVGNTFQMPNSNVTVSAVLNGPDCPFVVTTWADLRAKMATGGYIRLNADVTDPYKTNSSYLNVPTGKTVTLDLNGHTIDRGLTEETTQGYVIYVNGTLTLNDSSNPSTGRITGGYGASYGGGVNVSGSFTMNSGTISGNTSKYGGGVCVSRTFTMNGGTISGNTSKYGGGVYLADNTTFTMNGGTICGNTSGSNGGGVYLQNDRSTFNVSGNPVITGNTNAAGKEENFYLNNVINIDAPLTAGAFIGVTSNDPPSTGGDPVEIATGATDGDSQYFYSDITCYTIKDGQGEQAGKLLLTPPASTPWSKLKENLEAGGTNGVVTLSDNVTALDCDGGYPYITKTVTLDLNGHNITVNENSDHVILMSDYGNLTLTGSGTISGSKEYVVNCNYSTSTFSMIGGTISGGTGGGVYVKNGTFNVSGSPVITGNTKDGKTCNVYLNTGKVINVTGALSADARIGVTTKTAPTAGNPVTFAQGSGNYTLTDADVSRFSSDVSGYFIGFDNENHVAYLTVDATDANIIITLADNADNTSIITDNNSKTRTAVLSGRTLYKDGAWNTLCLPFDATLTGDLADATLMELDTEAGSYEHVTGLDNGTLYLNFKDATSIEAGKPYIIKWDGTYIGDPIVNPVFPGVTINNSASTEVSFEGGKFVGTYKPIVWSEENKSILFLGDNNTLYWPKPEGDNMPHLNAFRAYFELIDVNGVREIKLNYGDEEITAVANSQLSTLNSTLSEWYDMQGRKVSKPTKKGMYIHKGSKVVIK